jgi:two-component system NarL family sensor kinase
MVASASLLDRFAAGLAPIETDTLALVRDYLAWQTNRQATEFTPDKNDDVDLRTYLLELRLGGRRRAELETVTAALKRFYNWAREAKLVEASPFAEYNFDRPFLSRDQIRRRQDDRAADPQEREIKRLRALNRLAEHLNRSHDLQTALDATLETLVEIMGLQTAWIFLWSASGLTQYTPHAIGAHDLRLAAHCGLPPGLTEDNFFYLCDPPDCHCQALLRKGQLTRAVNVVECTRLQDSAEAAGDNRGLLFHATVPLFIGDQPTGILNVATDEWQFLSAADLQLLSAVSAQVSAAMERARLFAQSAELGAVEERNRLAREIHDTLAQGLTAITLQLETADALLEREPAPRAREAVQHALALARLNLEEARRSMLDLRAAPLEGRTLDEALAALADDWGARGHWQVKFESVGGERPLPLRVEASLYRIAQEALNNVIRHAQARTLKIELGIVPTQVRLIIADDGRGFDPAAMPQGRFGLVGLNERVHLLGGTLKLESNPGAGTRVEVTIPLERKM